MLDFYCAFTAHVDLIQVVLVKPTRICTGQDSRGVASNGANALSQIHW